MRKCGKELVKGLDKVEPVECIVQLVQQKEKRTIGEKKVIINKVHVVSNNANGNTAYYSYTVRNAASPLVASAARVPQTVQKNLGPKPFTLKEKGAVLIGFVLVLMLCLSPVAWSLLTS